MGEPAWIFCCGMYRSASTLQFQIAARLVKDGGVGQQVGWIDWKRFPEVRNLYANYNGLKVTKVHTCSAPIISEFVKNNAKGIYIFRDIRDVYTSSMKQRLKAFDQLWNEGFIESCLDNYKKWNSLPRVLVSNYEEVVENLPREVKRIATHMDVNISLDSQRIADGYTVEIQQKRIGNFKDKLLRMPETHENKDREIVDYYDEESLLHINHIDSGKVGRWKEELSIKEVALIDNKVINWRRLNECDPSRFIR